ncbi:hypothetical protein MKX01_015283 [Papaver californicum]|nr:hypothetical protein MKX01_015283 [Papaver californicum]
MGCCFSRNHEVSEQNPPPKLIPSGISRLSPPIAPQLEEETVKEVLSETPSQKRPSSTKLKEQKQNPTILPSFPKSEVSEEEEKKIENKQVPYYMTTPTTTQEVSVSEVSEICSLSESYSTTTLTKEDIEEGEVRQQQRIERSPSKIPQRRRSSNNKNSINDYQHGISGIDYHHNRERRSPVRRSSEQPSPNRRNENNNGFKFGSNNTDIGRRQRIYTANNNNNNNRSRRDPGESSGRRSRSPSVTRNNTNEVMGQNKSGMGRSPSERKAGRSPARIPPMASENSSKSETSKEDVEGNGNESLETPLVSLECFIFL